MKISIFVTILCVFYTLSTTVAYSRSPKEGPIVVTRPNGKKAYGFAFIYCKGKLYLDFHKDAELNEVTIISKRRLSAKYQNDELEFTFFRDGTLIRQDDSEGIWAYAHKTNLKQKPIKEYFKTAKKKCK